MTNLRKITESSKFHPSMTQEQIYELLKFAPWLNDAKFKNALIEIHNNDVIVWHNGTWENGTWKDGIWKKGTWKDGKWKNGWWYNGT